MSENSENTQDQLSLKQELLKEEIIAKNYDGQQFLEYCINLRENGDDMNNWTYDELKLVVQNFVGFCENKKAQSKIKKQTTQEINKEDNTNKNNNIKENEINDNKEIKKDSDDNNKKDQEKKEENNKINKEAINNKKEENILESKITEISCNHLEKSILNDKEIKVTIKNPKTNEKTLLSLPYVTYEVYTEPSCWLVRRRYSDFSLLRNILCKFYPKYFIPPLPEKKIGNKRFQPEFIEKRMRILQMFIDEVTCNETFKTNEALFIFLNLTDHSLFEKNMKEISNKSFNQNSEEIKTINGKAYLLKQDNNTDIFFSKIYNYYKNQKQALKKLSNSLKNYYKNVQNLCQNLEEISKSFDELKTLHKTLNLNIEEEVTKTYEILNIYFQEKKRMMKNENEIINQKIKGFFKMQRLKGTACLEMFDSKESLRQKYYSESAKLNAKKEKLYTSVKDINKWEINNLENIDKPLLLRDKKYAFERMCSKESQNIDASKKLLEFFNYINYAAVKKINKERVKSYVDNLKEFTELIFPYINDMYNVGKKLKSYI